VLHHSSVTDQIEEQESIVNVDGGEVGTSSNKDNYRLVENAAVRGCPSDGPKATWPLSTERSASHLNKSCKNVNCHVGNKVGCLAVPKVKLQYRTVDEDDDLETSLSPLNTFAHDSSTTEEHTNKASEWNDPKPETTPPRLVRQNSYTLVAPSPLLVAHIKMQNGKNSVHDMTESSNISTKPCRGASDLGKPRKKWELNREKGNSSFAPLNKNTDNKINLSGVNRTTSAFSLVRRQPHRNSSLPASNASSPVKLQTPFASLDCLPSAVSVESVNTFPQPSPRRENKCVCQNSISSAASKETKTSNVSQEKSTTKRLRRDSPTEVPSMASQGSPKKINEVKIVPLSYQQDLQGLILHLQTQHSQQMAALLAKQRMEQEELREVFLRQQNELMLEVCKVYPATFYAPGSQKQPAQQTPPCDLLTRHDNRIFNSSVNQIPSDLSSESSLPVNANTLETPTRDMGGKCVLSDTNFRRPSADMGRNVTDSNLCQERDRTQGPNEMTPHLQDEPSTFRTSITGSTSTQILAPPELGILQEHSRDCGEENATDLVDICDINCGALPVPSNSEVVSNVPTSETTSMNHSLLRTEAEFRPGSVPSSLFAHGSNSVDAKDGQNNSIKGRSPCIRQLFPAHEKPSALHITPRNCCDLEKVRRCLFVYVSVVTS
jgi:hypothetical protein